MGSEGRSSLAEEHSLTSPPQVPKAEPEPVMSTARTRESSSMRRPLLSRPDVSSVSLALDRRGSCSINHRQEF